MTPVKHIQNGGGSVAVGLLHPTRAFLAHHLAAPHELTVALLQNVFDDGEVATPTTHEITAVQPSARTVAQTPFCAVRPALSVILAKVRRVVQIDQIGLARSLLVLLHSAQALLSRM